MENLVELNIIKEYLLDEIHKLYSQAEIEIEKARDGKVSEYVINMISLKFEDRENHLKHLLDDILFKIKEFKKNNNILT
jgi:hypothetical protein